ncbi:MAG: MFS transporter [Clostridia bacterium]|nr:MFS transporter [Clostridia bacterium]
MKMSDNAKKAVFIGSLCSVAYFAVYVARNALSAVTPQMLEGGFTEGYIGKISSVYFIVYAIGQLINGFVGEKIKARYMISFGLLLAGICNFLFPMLSGSENGVMIVYGMTGFFLAMIYGPMTKVVAENVEPIYAPRCSIGYELASFLGSPSAGMLAVFLPWQGVFISSSVVLMLMGVIAFSVFFAFEKKGLISYGQYRSEKHGAAKVKVLFKHQIVKFCLIAILTGVVRTSVVFWLPTYISQYLGFSAQTSAAIFSVVTFIMATITFITVFIYERLKRNMDKTILLLFSVSLVAFISVYFVKHPVLNIILLVLAIMSSMGVSTMMWSRYCPGLRDTGMVSTVTGFLDFLSYMAAAVANLVFANAVTSIGWGNLILVWTALVAIGVIVALPYNKIFKLSKTNGKA